MKKIISILISVCLILMAIVPSVFAYEKTSFSVSNVIQDNDTYLVYVKGTGEPDSFISITVIDKNGNRYVALEQCTTNNGGVFTKTFPVRNPGEYTVIVNNYTSNSRASQDLRLYSKTEIDDTVGEFKKSSSLDEMKFCIAEYGSIFGFDTKYYNDDSADAVASQMIDMRASFEKGNITEKFDEAVLRAYIYNKELYADNIIEYYDNITSIVSSPVGMYEYYKAMDSTEKARVQSIAFEAPVKEISDLCEVFYMAVVADKAKHDSNTKFDEFISNFTEYLGLEGYENISTTKKSKLLNAIKASDIPDNTEDFSKLYMDLKKELIDGSKDTEKPATGGGGGGGGGGISAPTQGSGIGYEKPEIVNPPKPDVSYSVGFSDLDGHDWAKTAITDLASKGIVNGKDDDKFAPADYITREEFAKIIVLAYGIYDEDAKCDFTDVSEDRWSYKYIASSYGYGITNGYPDGTFGATNLLTREEMAVMLYRVLSKQLKIEILTETKSTLKDIDEVSDFAKTSVSTLNTSGIISGDDSGNFNPKANATRAEVCQMIYNALNREGGRI